MRIKSFRLGGHRIKVKYVKSVFDPGSGQEIFGRANFATNVIEVATRLNGQPLAEDVVIHTLYHEAAHFILHLLGEHELNGNEKLVDGIGLFMQQFFQTAK
jgi:hypothetical protein